VHFHLQDEGEQAAFFSSVESSTAQITSTRVNRVASRLLATDHARSFFFLLRTSPDADELEWYIPAGIVLSDLQRSLAVIEQFEKTPLDLNGKRASQLLIKKRRRRRRRRADSDDEASGDNDEDDSDEPRRARKKAREWETYKSAQFIEDSDEEYGRDIDEFFAREAELRQRTALAAVESSLNIGTMRPSGTKKRRRAQAPSGGSNATTAGRVAKRRAVQSSSGTPGGNGEGQDQGAGEHGGINAETPRPTSIDDGDGDDGVKDVDEHDADDSDSSSRSLLADRDAAASSAGGHRHSDARATPQVGRPRARPRYQGAQFRGPSDAMSDSVTPETGRHEDDGGHYDRSPVEHVHDDNDELDTGLRRHHQQQQQQQQQASSGGLLRKGRLIISDEE